MCPIDLKKITENKSDSPGPHAWGTSRFKKYISTLKKKKIKVISDNCESMGAKFNKNILINW